jgi:excisionase family DNA binding protein
MSNPQGEPLQHVTWYRASRLSYGTARAFLMRMRAMNMDYPDVAAERPSEPRIGRSVSLDHAAQMLGVSRRTIYNRIRDGRLQTIRTVGGSQRVLIESVLDRRNRVVNPFVRPTV